MWVSELLPYTAKMVDDMCFIRSMHTEAINHEPAITLHANRQPDHRPAVPRRVGFLRPRLAQRKPADVRRARRQADQHRADSGHLRPALVGAAILPSEHAGVSFRSAGDPILYINNPAGVSTDVRRQTLDGLRQLNEMNYQQVGDPETHTRIRQYELAFRMQASVPELTDTTAEPASTLRTLRRRSQKARHVRQSALLARRLVERGVRFVQIYHNNWDTHGNVAGRLPIAVQGRRSGLLRTDSRPEAARAARRDAGHLGRRIRPHDLFAGPTDARQLRPRSSSALLHDVDGRRRHRSAGTIYGETDDFSYNIVKDPVHVHDFHATVLRLLGFDHERFTFRYQGLDQRLTGVEATKVVQELIA